MLYWKIQVSPTSRAPCALRNLDLALPHRSEGDAPPSSTAVTFTVPPPPLHFTAQGSLDVRVESSICKKEYQMKEMRTRMFCLLQDCCSLLYPRSIFLLTVSRPAVCCVGRASRLLRMKPLF